MKTTRFFYALTLLLLIYPATWTLASDNGITGRTTTGCGGGGCHSGNSTATTTNLSGATTLLPGASTVLMLTIQNSGRPRSGCDIDFVNSSGVQQSGLAVVSGQGMRSIANELTHSSPKNMSSGQSTWQFKLTAPAAMGLYKVRYAANATTSQNSGDYSTNSTDIIVKGLSLTAPSGNQIFCAGTSVTLQWNCYGVNNLLVQLSSDAGTSFTTVSSLTSINGSNSATFTIPQITPPGTSYRIRLVDATDANLSSAMTTNCTVISPHAITQQPSPLMRNVCEGASLSYTVTATGTGLLYQWRKDGIVMNAQNAATLSLNSVTNSNSGVYDCVVQSSCGTDLYTNPVSLSVQPAGQITQQPQSATTCIGQVQSFSVQTIGSGLSYQWKHNNQTISGATGATYTINQLSAADSGDYICVISASCGSSFNSTTAHLSTVSPPHFTQSPYSQEQCESQTLHLISAVQDPTGLSYQWYKDGKVIVNDSRISGATTEALSITSLQSLDAGQYTVKVQSTICATTQESSPAIIAINAPPTITKQPLARSALPGTSVSFSVEAKGSGLRYQWKKDGKAIAGATQSSLSLTNLSAADQAEYSVTIDGRCASLTSNAVRLSVVTSTQPVLTLDAAALHFGATKIGTTREMKINISNSGTAPLVMTKLEMSGVDASLFEFDTTIFTLEAGQSRAISCRFHPSSTQHATALIKLNSNGGGNAELTIDGNGIERALSPGRVILPPTQVGQRRDTIIRLCNQSSDNLQLNAIQLSGNLVAFRLADAQLNARCPLTLRADSCMDIVMIFEPASVGQSSATLEYQSSAGNEQTIINASAVLSAVEDNAASSLMTPNPCSDYLEIQVPSEMQRLELRLFDALGRVVLSSSMQSGHERVDCRHLTNGLYLVELSSAAYQQTQLLRVMH